MKIAASMILATSITPVWGGTIAWYRFDEGSIGSRVGSSIVIENAANPGHLTGRCQQIDTAGAFSDTDTGYMPTSIAAFPYSIGVLDSVAKKKYANDRAFFFHTSTWDANHAVVQNADTGLASGVIVPRDNALELDSFTVECFFRSSLGDAKPSGHSTLIALPNNQNSPTAYSWGIMISKEGYLVVHLWNQTNYQFSKNGIDGHDGKWHHVAVTYDGSDKMVHVYFDYVDVAHAAIANGVMYGSTFPLAIGCSPATNYRKWIGSIDEVRISNTVLSSTDFLHRTAYVAAVDNEDTACYVPCNYTTLANLEEFAAESTLKDINAARCGDVTAEITWKPTNGASLVVDGNAVPCATLYSSSFAGGSWSWMSITNTASFTLPTGTTAGYSGSIIVRDIKDNAHTVFNGSFTVELFAKIPSAPGGNRFLMNLGRTLASGSLLYAMVNKTTGDIDFYVEDRTSGRVKIGTYAEFCDNNWHHVAISYDRNALTAKAYVDYKNVGTVANLDFDYDLTVSDTPAALQINNAYGWRELGLDGAWIDEFRLWRRALSRKELLSPVLNKLMGMTVIIQ